MSYRVLLVDDEPIILSGIKFLIDWEKNDCQVIGTARNGQQALDFIRQAHPEIVICDINMPLLSGIELLKKTAEEDDSSVFIMLTNHQEFDLARQSLRLKAVDYLLKSQLEAEALERSLAVAKEECLRRGNLAKIQMAESYLELTRTQVIAETVKKLLAAPEGSIPAEQAELLSSQGVTNCFCLVQLMLDFSALPALESFTNQERDRLYDWEREIVEKLAGNLFSGFCAVDPDGARHSLVLYCWDVPEATEETLRRLYAKLCSASEKITQTRLSLLSTQIFRGAKFLEKAVRQLSELQEYYYFTQCEFAIYGDLPMLELQSIPWEECGNRITTELRARNAVQCEALLKKISDSLIVTPHRRNNGRNMCTTLYSVAASILSAMLPEEELSEFFISSAVVMQRICTFTTRSEVVAFLDELQAQITSLLEQLSEGKSDPVEKARCYILENVDKRIMLQDVANAVNISPNYLSSLFKKEFNQSLVDFINAAKMERACALIREDKYRIYEISYMLSFENAYYFTKVFKKHTGLTPTEYQRKVQKES